MRSEIEHKGEFWHFFSLKFSKFLKFSVFFVPVPFCQLVQIWNLFLSICIDSKDLQSNFEVPVVCGSLIFPYRPLWHLLISGWHPCNSHNTLSSKFFKRCIQVFHHAHLESKNLLARLHTNVFSFMYSFRLVVCTSVLSILKHDTSPALSVQNFI